MEKMCRECLVPKPVQAFDPRRAKCKECVKDRRAAYYVANKDRHLEAGRQWREKNPEKVKAIRKRQYDKGRESGKPTWAAVNPDKASEYSKRYRKLHTETLSERRRAYYANVVANSERMLAMKYASVARYKAAKLRAIPPWADEEKTREIYREAKELRALGVDCHVDHIQPLRGKMVCGLHWHGNLRIILAHENHAKNATPPPDSEALAVSLSGKT